ncbi:MAG TPA: flagellar biosynthesis protein FlhF, partial [Methyloversatilis sp.]
MTPRKYVAASARDALRRIKEDLGPDAIVLSNRPVEGGVEILALPANALETMMPPAKKPVARPQPVEPVPPADEDDFQVTLSSSVAARSVAPREAAPAEPVR